MTSIQQRAELHRQIWQIANDVRGSVDGWDFKQYVLGALFYRFISENFSSYIEAGDDSICYAKLDDSVITDDIKDDAIKTKGYFIYPSQLFCNVAAKANTNDRLNADLNSIFVAGFAPIFPDICYHLTHYKPAAADIPVASDNPAHYADAIRYNARTPLQGSLLPLTRLVWA